MTSPTEFLPGIFVGDQFAAKNPRFFQEANIKKVVNCTPDVPFYFENSNVQYKRISLGDSPDEINNNIMETNLLSAVKFVLDGHKFDRKNGVLIHCHVGISRSCTVAVAVIRMCCAQSIPQAVAMLLTRRPIAFYNGTRLNFSKALYNVFFY